MQDTLAAIILLCDADRVAASKTLRRGLSMWTVGDAVRRYQRGGYERDYALAREWHAESESRLIGQDKGVRFRLYRRWGEWPIKAYGFWAGPEGKDFKTWGEALEWIRGL
jgi:hypothetical protein